MPLAPKTPSWRWQKVVAAADYSLPKATFLLSSEDPLTRRVFDFYRAMNSGRHMDQADPLSTAYELFMNREKLKLYTECLLLTGMEDAEIAKKLPGVTPEEVSLFHDVFFAVRPWRLIPSWIVETVLNGELYQPLSRRDLPAMYHRISWICGPDILDLFWTGRVDQERKPRLVEFVHNYLQMQSALTAMTFGNRGEDDVEMLKVIVESTRDVIQAAPALDTEQKARDTVTKFLAQFPIGVASPKESANLKLSAREPRLTDLTKEVVCP